MRKINSHWIKYQVKINLPFQRWAFQVGLDRFLDLGIGIGSGQEVDVTEEDEASRHVLQSHVAKVVDGVVVLHQWQMFKLVTIGHVKRTSGPYYKITTA